MPILIVFRAYLWSYFIHFTCLLPAYFGRFICSFLHSSVYWLTLISYCEIDLNYLLFIYHFSHEYDFNCTMNAWFSNLFHELQRMMMKKNKHIILSTHTVIYTYLYILINVNSSTNTFILFSQARCSQFYYQRFFSGFFLVFSWAIVQFSYGISTRFTTKIKYFFLESTWNPYFYHAVKMKHSSGPDMVTYCAQWIATELEIINV